MARIITMGNALVDVMTLLEGDETLDNLNLPKGSMQLVDFETSQKILKYTDNLKKSLACGGSAANTARSLAELGAEIAYVGKVGLDETGKFFEKDTVDAGVIPLLSSSVTPTGTAIALVSKDSERTFATYLGAAAEISPDDINAKLFEGYDLLHIEGYLIFNNELIEKVVKTAKTCGLKVSIDLASYNVVEANLDFLRTIINKYVDIVFANEEEAKAFTGKNPCEALEYISEMCEIAIVKLGEHGSMIKNNNCVVEESAIKVLPIDTTGAGDNFAAGFLYGYINGWSFEKSAKAGSILAGNVIEVVGTKMDKSRWTKIKEKIADL